jgi:outer membrane protein TolC
MLVVAFVGLLAPRALWGQEPSRDLELPAPLERQSLVSAVLQRNPSLEAMRQAWQALQQREAQARALDDPMLSYGLAPLSIGSGRVNLGQEVRLSQRFPYPGTLRLRADMARAEADEAGQAFEAERLRLALGAAQLFDEYALLLRAFEINEQHVQLVEEFQRVATARYAAGLVPQQDPLQAEVEAAHLTRRQIVLRTNRDVVKAQINALLHRSPSAPLPIPAALTVPSGELPELAALEAEVATRRPEIGQREAVVRARQAEVGLKKLEGRPSFEAMASYNSMWMDGQHRLMVGVGVNLPVWRKRVGAAVAEAEARLQQARSERAAAEDEVRSGLRQAYDRLQELRQSVDLYQSRLLPATADQVRAALAAFKTSQTSFLSVIEAERNQRTAEMDFVEILRDYARARAELDRAAGLVPGGPPAETIPVTGGDLR